MYRALTDAILTGKRLHSVGSAGASPVHQSVPVQRHEEHLTAAAWSDRGKEHLQEQKKKKEKDLSLSKMV